MTSLACPLCDRQESEFYFTDPKNYQHTYHHCPRCDLVFVIPECRLTQNDEKYRYDMHENDYSDAYIQFLSRLAKPTLNYLSKQQLTNASGLDFGSGKSQAMANLFRQAGHRCECYDIFYYPDTALLQQQYDFIVASEVIEHLYDPKVIFEQWLSLLKPSGILAIMTGFRPTDKDFPNWWYKNDPTHVSLFSTDSFLYLKERYRLQIIHTDKNIILFKQAND